MKLTTVLSLILVGMAFSRCALTIRRHRREAAAGADPGSAVHPVCLVGGALWVEAAGGCQSCGSECAAACGTRQFRTCCFNYLRRKRATPAPLPPAGLKLQLWLAKNQDPEAARQRRLPVFLEPLSDPPSPAHVAYDLDQLADPLESQLQLIYDA